MKEKLEIITEMKAPLKAKKLKSYSWKQSRGDQN